MITTTPRVLLTIGLFLVGSVVFTLVRTAVPVELVWVRVVLLFGVVAGMLAGIKRLWARKPNE